MGSVEDAFEPFIQQHPYVTIDENRLSATFTISYGDRSVELSYEALLEAPEVFELIERELFTEQPKWVDQYNEFISRLPHYITPDEAQALREAWIRRNPPGYEDDRQDPSFLENHGHINPPNRYQNGRDMLW